MLRTFLRSYIYLQVLTCIGKFKSVFKCVRTILYSVIIYFNFCAIECMLNGKFWKASLTKAMDAFYIKNFQIFNRFMWLMPARRRFRNIIQSRHRREITSTFNQSGAGSYKEKFPNCHSIQALVIHREIFFRLSPIWALLACRDKFTTVTRSRHWLHAGRNSRISPI